MSVFTTRVELYGDPSFDTYKKLHSAMEGSGFSRQRKFGEVTYWLPNAEYSFDGTQTIAGVKNLAVIAATSVWKDFGVLVTQTEVAREHHNLKKA